MKTAVWVEISVHTDEQVATISYNETRDGVVLTINELEQGSKPFSIYLDYDEALELSQQIQNFISNKLT